MSRIPTFAALASAVALATASSAAPTSDALRRSDLCYFQCQLECYTVYPGGGPQWRACYIACSEDRCDYDTG